MKTSKLSILTLFLFFAVCVFSGYEYYMVQEQTKRLSITNILLEETTKQVDSLKISLKELNSSLKTHDYRLYSLEADMESIFKWSNVVVKWSRQF